MEWTLIEDKLPPFDEKVLLCFSDAKKYDIVVGFLDLETSQERGRPMFYVPDYDHLDVWYFCHWMPLPPLPK